MSDKANEAATASSAKYIRDNFEEIEEILLKGSRDQIVWELSHHFDTAIAAALEHADQRYRTALEHYADESSWQTQTNLSILKREYADYTRNGYEVAQAALKGDE